MHLNEAGSSALGQRVTVAQILRLINVCVCVDVGPKPSNERSEVGRKGTPLGHVGRSDLPRWAAHRGFCHLQKATFSGDDSDHKILRRR